MADWIAGYWAFQVLFVAVVLILSWLVWDKRYKKRDRGDVIPPGFERTQELNIDPGTNRKQRVYYHPGTGERIYVDEP